VEVEPGVKGGVIGLGVDLVEVERFGELIRRRKNALTRLFAVEELAYTDSLADPIPSLAARFAAKEATMKALQVGLGSFDWIDVAVERASSGAPTLLVRGRAERLAVTRGVAGWLVSLSHTDSIAAATVVACS
jgi:holo-[acyl-carrier protein] synthase